MFYAFPTESIADAFELLCYGFTVAAAVLSYLVTLRP